MLPDDARFTLTGSTGRDDAEDVKYNTRRGDARGPWDDLPS